MPILVLQLRLALAIVNSAPVCVGDKEDPMVHGIGDPGKMHIVEATRGLVAEDKIDISSKDLLWGCRSNFCVQRHPFERLCLENCQRCRPSNGTGWLAWLLQHQLAIDDCPCARTIQRPRRKRVWAIQFRLQ